MATHVKSFDLIGKKENVADYIEILTPSDTPFLTSIKTESIEPKNTYFQWLEDTLRAPAKNTALEGADAVDTDRTQPSIRFNGTQILTETFKVSGTAQVVKTYGREGAVAYETMKVGKAMKMDLEHSLVGTGQTYVAAAGATAGEFAGVQAQIHAAVTTDAGAGATDPLTETVIVNTQEKVENEGSEVSILMVKPSDTKIIAGFAQLSSRTRELGASDKKITNVINIYESPFGTLKVVKNKRLRETEALLYSPEHWKLMVLRDWFREKLARTGDADRWQVLGEFSLKHTHQKADGLINGLS